MVPTLAAPHDSNKQEWDYVPGATIWNGMKMIGFTTGWLYTMEVGLSAITQDGVSMYDVALRRDPGSMKRGYVDHTDPTSYKGETARP